MSETIVNFQKIDLRAASDYEYECLGKFKNILNREYFPDDPPVPLEEQIQNWRSIPEFVEIDGYIGWNDSRSEILAYCDTGLENIGSNEHIAFFRIEILPPYRCQGLGRQMLGMILPFAKEHQRSLLMIWTNDRIPAAAVFLERIGARRGQEGRVNQLKVSELDRN